MAATTHAVSTPSTSNVTSYASGAFTPAVGDLLVVFVMASATAAAGSLSNSAGITFHTATTAVKGTSADKMWCFIANSLVASAVSMTVTFDCTGDAATGCIIKVARVSGMSKTGSAAVKQSGVQNNIASGGTPAVTLGAARDTNNPTLGAVANNDGTDPVATEPSGWTKLGTDSVYATPNNGMNAVFRDSGETSATVTWGSTVSGGQHCTIVVELDASSSGVTVAVDTPGAMTLAGKTIATNLTVPVSTIGAMTLAGQGGILPTTLMPVTPGAMTLAGKTIATNLTMVVAPGAMTLAGQAGIALVQGTVLPVTPGAVTLAGQAVTEDLTMVVSPGALTLAGQNVILGVPTVITVDTPGALVLAGQAVTEDLSMLVSPGAMALAGQAVGQGVSITVTPGAVVLAGQVVTEDLAMVVSPGTLVLTGKTVDVIATSISFETDFGITDWGYDARRPLRREVLR